MDMIEEQVQAKQKAEERFGKVLAWIEAQHREPNERERAHLKKALGEMKPGIRRMLKQTSEDGAYKRKVSMPGASLKTGTRLLREWHCVTHEVILTEDGVQFQGKRYRSLSEVARIITGTRWSGPLFFGLKKREAA